MIFNDVDRRNKKDSACTAAVLADFAEHVKPASRQDQGLAKADQRFVLKLAEKLKREAISEAGHRTLLSRSNVKITTRLAQALVSEFKAPLYNVELNRLLGKYIGETEKNLSALFSDGEKHGAILFFDEADALFGKRSEVNDTHDRYANMGVSLLLQKIAPYSGLTIIAFNKKTVHLNLVRRLGK